MSSFNFPEEFGQMATPPPHIPFTTGTDAVQALEAISKLYACFGDKPETVHMLFLMKQPGNSLFLF